jgi:hypothetical protein
VGKAERVVKGEYVFVKIFPHRASTAEAPQFAP